MKAQASANAHTRARKSARARERARARAGTRECVGAHKHALAQTLWHARVRARGEHTRSHTQTG
eukprot:13367745-Alexandrium_andersonii.AAC.1